MELGNLAECCGAIGTILAVLLALSVVICEEPLRRLGQRRATVEIVDDSQIKQKYSRRKQIKSRFKIENKGRFTDTVKVDVMEIIGRKDFIEVPLVWLHGRVMGEDAPTVKEIGPRQSAWLDFVTVDTKWGRKRGLYLHLNLGIGRRCSNLELLGRRKTELLLRIDPRYAKRTYYIATVEWDGTYSYPEIDYRKTTPQV